MLEKPKSFQQKYKAFSVCDCSIEVTWLFNHSTEMSWLVFCDMSSLADISWRMVGSCWSCDKNI